MVDAKGKKTVEELVVLKDEKAVALREN